MPYLASECGPGTVPELAASPRIPPCISNLSVGLSCSRGSPAEKKERKKEAAIKAARFVNFVNIIDFLEKIRLSADFFIHIRNEKTKQ